MNVWSITNLSDRMDEKKAEKLLTLSETLTVPDVSDPEATILELDELWSFVQKKTNQAWIWIALCRKTRQAVSYAIGDRSKNTCRKLWEASPEVYRGGHCFTDFWFAYQAVIPEEQHTAVGKETGEMLMWSAGIAPCDNVWLALFVKRSLSPNLWQCMIFACASFFIAIILNGLVFSYEPLPKPAI